MTSKVDEALGYEQARDELIEVVRRLEAGGTTLEESLALWERGEELARGCRRWLEGGRGRLDAGVGRGGLSPGAGAGRAGPLRGRGGGALWGGSPPATFS